MLEWHDFVEQLLSEESSFDGISLSFDGTAHSVGVPPIIKASVLILDKMITHQGKFNILVFPERIQSIFIFTLIKLLHNIAEGKIERAYDPEAFKPGEKLKLGNAVVEFVGIEDEKNERRMKIKVADLTISAPIEYFPLFQLTNTQRRLSPYEKYVVEKKKIEGLISHLTADEKFLKILHAFCAARKWVVHVAVQDFMKLQDIVLRNWNRVKALVNDTQHVAVSGDLLLISVPRRGFLLDELPDSGARGNDALNGIRCLGALYLGNLHELFKFLRTLLQIQFLLSGFLVYGRN